MGHPVPVHTSHTSTQLRGLAKRCEDAGQARRLLSIAAVLDGASRAEAARIGAMDRQTLRDCSPRCRASAAGVHRFNTEGPDGLIERKAPGAAPKLTAEQKAALAKKVADGPIAAVDGVVRWRARDLQQWIHEEFGVSVSDETVYRMLKALGIAHVGGRPQAYRQNEDVLATFKKTSARPWWKFGPRSARTRRLRSGSKTR